MANDINAFTVVGRLTRDSELKYASNGTAILKINVASNYSVKKGDKWEEEALFMEAILFGNRAEKLTQYLVKGSRVGLAGELHMDSWTDKDGNKKSRVVMHPNSVQLLDSKSSNTAQPQPAQAPQQSDDDIPF